MRLTHSITIEDTGRDALTIAYEPDATSGSGRPIVLTLATEDATIYLSHEQYDVIADLVWAHRPEHAIKDAEIVGDHCTERTPESDYGCILKDGHLPVFAGQWTHMNRDGLKFNDVSGHSHEWQRDYNGPTGGEVCMTCGLTRIVR